MPRAKHKYHFLYKTTNLKNGKYYLGMHSTSNLDDGYLGSGDRLKRSIRKYGKENFKFEILEFFESREDLSNAEKKLITENDLKDPMCMNLRLGGKGGLIDKEHHKKMCLGASNWLKEKWKDEKYKKIFISNSSKNMTNNLIFGKIRRCDWSGRKHKEETKKKIGEKNSHSIGDKNSQFGTMWITNGKENKKIKKNEILPPNWYFGRIILKKQKTWKRFGSI